MGNWTGGYSWDMISVDDCWLRYLRQRDQALSLEGCFIIKSDIGREQPLPPCGLVAAF